MAYRSQNISKNKKYSGKDTLPEELDQVPWDLPPPQKERRFRPAQTDAEEPQSRPSSSLSQTSDYSISSQDKTLRDDISSLFDYVKRNYQNITTKLTFQEDFLRDLSKKLDDNINKWSIQIDRVNKELDKVVEGLDKKEESKQGLETNTNINDCLITINDTMKELKDKRFGYDERQEETEGAIQSIKYCLDGIDSKLDELKEENGNLTNKILKEILPTLQETTKSETDIPTKAETVTEIEDKQQENQIHAEMSKTYAEYSSIKSLLFKNGKKFPAQQVKDKLTDTEQFHKFQTYRDRITEWYVKGQHFAKRWRAQDHKPRLFTVKTTWSSNITEEDQIETIKQIALTCKGENRKLQLKVAKRISNLTEELTELLTNNLQSNELLFAKAFRSVIFKYWTLRDRKDERLLYKEEEDSYISQQ